MVYYYRKYGQSFITVYINLHITYKFVEVPKEEIWLGINCPKLGDNGELEVNVFGWEDVLWI